MKNELLTSKFRILLIVILLISATGLIILLDNKDHYTGNYKDGKYHGYGRIEFSDGNIFEGYIVEGNAEGYGKFTFSNGERLEGVWEGKHFRGPGKYIFSDGTTVEIKTEDGQLLEKLKTIEI